MKKYRVTQILGHIALHGMVAVSLFILPAMVNAADAAPAATAAAQAPDAFVPLTQLPGLSEAAGSPSLSVFLNYLYKLCIGAAAVIAVLQMMRAGVEFMVNKGSVTTNEVAKSRIQNSVFGLILVLSPAIVFGIINPSILNLDLNVSGLKSSVQNSASTAPTLTTLQQAQAKGITKKESVAFIEGQNGASICSAKGSGWAQYDVAICAIPTTDSTHICCAYNPADDKTPAPVANVETNSGKYSYEYFMSQTDSGGNKCMLSGKRAFTTQAACTADITKYSSGANFAVANNCEGKLTPPFPPQMYQPASAYASISKLPDCT